MFNDITIVWHFLIYRIQEINNDERISMFANGSLYIRNIVGSDAADYVCRTENEYGADEITLSLIVQGMHFRKLPCLGLLFIYCLGCYIYFPCGWLCCWGSSHSTLGMMWCERYRYLEKLLSNAQVVRRGCTQGMELVHEDVLDQVMFGRIIWGMYGTWNPGFPREFPHKKNFQLGVAVKSCLCVSVWDK